MKEEKKNEKKNDNYNDEIMRRTKTLARLTWINVALAAIASVIHWCGGNMSAGAGWMVAAIAWVDLARERWWTVRFSECLCDSQSMLHRAIGILDRMFGSVAAAVVEYENEHNGCPTKPGEAVPEVVVNNGKGEEK